jgi:hypothetical protein
MSSSRIGTPDALTSGVGDSVRDRRRHPDKNDLAETLDPEWDGMRIDTSTNRKSITGVSRFTGMR